MNAYYSLKHELKIVRWQIRRASTAIRWGKTELQQAPIVLGNAMPKSGSHLIIQVLQGLTHIGPFVNTGFPPVNRNEINQKLPEKAILHNLQSMKSGDIGYGYLRAKEPFVSILTQPGRATIFVYRDPRDMIISQIFYATQIHKGHWMHRYYTEQLSSMEQRINATIQGVLEPGSELTPIRDRYNAYMPWLEQPDILSLRFEDLILDQEKTLGKLMDFLEEHSFTPRIPRSEAINVIKDTINPKKSGTFRKGKPGNWREYFTETNIKLFKEQTGDLLIRLGYEESQDW
jgi:hypothetical protein